MGGNSEKVNLGHIIENMVHNHWRSIKAVVANRPLVVREVHGPLVVREVQKVGDRCIKEFLAGE